MIRIYLYFIIFIFVSFDLYAQGRPYEGPEDPAGDISEMREGFMNGNRVLLYFLNNGQVADIFKFGYNNMRDSKWPNNYLGTRMIDVGTVVVFSKVFVENDSIPVTDLNQVASLKLQGKVDSLVYVQSGWIWNYDANYYRTIRWQFMPVRGYLNPAQDYIAMSNKEDSWPTLGWPSRGFETKWPGEWNGRFGRGIRYADLESYFVFNDAQDLEKIVQRDDPEENLIKNGPRYYPRPGKYIGDINPEVTVQKGYPWGGLGLRIAARGFQWNNPEAKDIIFWEFDITNISDYDLPISGFGYDVDMALGDEHLPDDDVGYFNTDLDMVYVWDYDGIGVGGIEPGTFATAYLESPGLAYDNIDNDEDGIVDEKRDNQAGEIVGPYYHIYNLDDFLQHYDLKEEDLREHFEGDEDQDWQDGFDANGNGSYAIKNEEGYWVPEPGEFAGDDVGLDGVGPLDINYNGPDAGECNHTPDFLEGLGCEPNFAVTDISESDMVGLTTFRLMSDIERSNNDWFHDDDETCFDFLNAHVFEEFTGGEPQRLGFAATSSTFPLFKGRTERISVALLHAYENLHEISAPGHVARNLFVLKQTTQIIYESDYRFAQPPLLPTLSATAGDGQVILTWDDVADKHTREPFLGRINDFEGYKLYRATDKYFQDAEIITDNQGAKASKKPIFQCDLVDNIKGNADYGEVGGVEFYLGDDTGISHQFVDNQVQNGRTYYYALVAYDFGAPGIGDGISPTENNITLELDESEEVTRMGKNIAIVIPHQMAAGYQDPFLEAEKTEPIGTAKVMPHIFDRNKVKPNHTYKVQFKVDTLGYIQRNLNDKHPLDFVLLNTGLKVYDLTENNKMIYQEDTLHYPYNNIISRDDKNTALLSGKTKVIKAKYYKPDEIVSDSFDGIQLKISGLNGYFPPDHATPAVNNGVNSETSGWITGNTPINVVPSEYEYYGFPYSYDIVFTDRDSAFVNRLNKKSGIKNLDGGGGNFLFDQAFSFYIVNQTAVDLLGKADTLELIVDDLNSNGTFDMFGDRIIAGHAVVRTLGTSKLISWGGTVFGFDFLQLQSEDQLPAPGDVYRFDFNRPFMTSDSIIFTTESFAEPDEQRLNDKMDEIKVVPNPYIMANSMEPAVANKFLNQRRRIMFTNIPARSVIHIFTSSGIVVDKIEVENEPSNGIIHWDLLSKEGLEIAAGMYIYHVKSLMTGKEKVGKFAVIK